ncbi:TIR domain-containing protein, partial [Phosphitispora fastidiosa]|uniref:TIR domain-containing protein n=1 Tax=Phosphitispora fastidiosa TaxID=2837202 RepID=UPI001E316334
MNIFLSYGHDEYSKLARRIKADLEVEGYHVWYDEEKIKNTHDWEISIEKGITLSDWVVVLMTPHSMRRPDGYCLDELSFARFQGKPIAPLMAQNVVPPLCIARLQWLDMQRCFDQNTGEINEPVYAEKYQAILKAVRGEFQLGFEGELATLRDILRPLDNDVEIDHRIRNFTGREWVFEAFRNWLEHDSSRVYWIQGKTGVGKTALAAKLCHQEPSVVGAHFCKYNDSTRSDPKRAICSLAYTLATQVPGYMQRLIEDKESKKIDEMNPAALFTYLLVEKLNKVIPPRGRKVLVIDALDESEMQSQNGLADILASQGETLPKWLGIVITSRPESRLLRVFSGLRTPLIMEYDDARNIRDIREFLNKKLTAFGDAAQVPGAVDKLVSKSQGNFRYIETVLKEFEKGTMDLTRVDEYPEGLNGVYTLLFERQFPDIEKYAGNHRRLFELIAATVEPLETKMVEKILGRDYEVDKTVLSLGSLFDSSKGRIEPFHKSVIEWLMDLYKSGEYRVRVNKGHEALARHGLKEYQRGLKKMSPYLRDHLPVHLERLIDEAIEDGDIDMEHFSHMEEVCRNLADNAYKRKRYSIAGQGYAVALRAGQELLKNESGNVGHLKLVLETAYCAGRCWKAYGSLSGALPYYHEAEDILKKLCEMEPENKDYLKSYSKNCTELGDIYRSLGNRVKAQKYYEKSLAIDEALVELDPDSAEYRRGVSVSYERLGDYHESQGNGAKALEYYQKSLAIDETLVELDPDSADYRRDLSVSYNKLGDYHKSQGNGAKALEYYEKS